MVRKILIFILFIIVIQNPVLGQETIIFEDNFNDNSNNWNAKNDNEAYIKVQSGKLVFEHKRTEKTWLAWNKVEINTKKNFSISCNSLWISGIDNNSYELCWGLLDVNNLYSFGISANGSYRYSICISGEWTNPIKWTNSE